MELQRFRETHDNIDRYDGYHIPNGNGFHKKSRPHNYKIIKTSAILATIVILFTALLVLLFIHFSQPSCECVSNATLNGLSFTQSDIQFVNLSYNNNRTDIINCILRDEVKPVQNISLSDSVKKESKIDIKDSKHSINRSVEKENENLKSFRLPTNLQPISYSIILVPHFLTNMTTSGQISIQFLCKSITDKVVLNVRDLNIDNSSLIVKSLSGDAVYQVIMIIEDTDKEMLTIQLGKNLTEGDKYNLYIKFSGIVRTMPNGLYKTHIPDQEESLAINTLFSPTDARSVFPCFDEPAFKVKISFIIGRPKFFSTISNMELMKSIPSFTDSNLIMDYFEESPPMSTYFASFVISKYKPMSYNSLTGIKTSFGAYTDSNKLNDMTYVMQLTLRLVEFFEHYLDIQYPLSKLDIVAVPKQYFTAMENWGLITIRQDAAHVDDKTEGSEKQSISLVLAHEVAHQWFGNLVTPKWWNSLWLKEGFAVFFGYFAINDMVPEWNTMNNFQVEIMDEAFQLDGLESSVALSRPINKPTAEIFDTIAYYKGSSVISMMSHFLGSSLFKQGVTSYLKNNAFMNADEVDLWNAIEENRQPGNKNGVKLKDVMDTWTQQPGFPVLNVVRDYELGSAVFVQSRFFLNGKTNNSSKWWIPVSYTTETEQNFQNTGAAFWINESFTLKTNITKGKEWLIVNLHQTGFYLVNYDVPNWVSLIAAYPKLPVTIRAQIISHSLYLAQGKQITYDVALSLLLQLTVESNYLPWQAAKHHAYFIGNLVKNMPVYGLFSLYVWSIVSKAYKEIDENNLWMTIEYDPMKQKHIENIIHMACYFDEQNCLQKALSLYNSNLMYPDSINVIPEALRSTIYCFAMKAGGPTHWDFTYKRLLREMLPAERTRLLKALGCTKEPWLITKTLSLIYPNDDIQLNAEEAMIVFESVSSNSMGHHIAVNFVREQWSFLLDHYNMPSYLYKMVYDTVGFTNTPHNIVELRHLVKVIERKTRKRSLLMHQAIEKAENNIWWMEYNYKQVEEFLIVFKGRFLN